MTSNRKLSILLVEDNLGDIRLTREALEESKISYRLHVVRDGVESLTFLRKKKFYKDVDLPDVIFLDLNLPKKNGRKVLTEIKHDEDLKSIPVIVLTSSDEEQDIINLYNLHANCYVKKPPDLDQFIKVVKSISNFWLYVVKLALNGRFI